MGWSGRDTESHQIRRMKNWRMLRKIEAREYKNNNFSHVAWEIRLPISEELSWKASVPYHEDRYDWTRWLKINQRPQLQSATHYAKPFEHYRQQRNNTLGKGPGEKPKALPVARCQLWTKLESIKALRGKTCSFSSWAERPENKLFSIFNNSISTTHDFSYLTPPRFVCTAFWNLYKALLFSSPPATNAEWPESCTLCVVGIDIAVSGPFKPAGARVL